MKKRKNVERLSQKGVPKDWDEVKRPCNLTLTPTAIAKLDAVAAYMDISRSELVERIGRIIDKLVPEVEELFEQLDFEQLKSV